MEENCYGRSARPAIKKTHQMTYLTQLYQTTSYRWIYFMFSHTVHGCHYTKACNKKSTCTNFMFNVTYLNLLIERCWWTLSNLSRKAWFLIMMDSKICQQTTHNTQIQSQWLQLHSCILMMMQNKHLQHLINLKSYSTDPSNQW